MLRVLNRSLLLFALLCLRSILAGDCTIRNKRFTSDVYKQYKETTTNNFIFSPFSAEIILALVEAGAKDDTSEEIRRVLYLPNNYQEIRRVIDEYFKSLRLDSNDFKVYIADKIYVQRELVVRDHFKQIATKVFRGEIERLDFRESTEAAHIINSSYFQAEWAKKFNSHNTKEVEFHTAETTVIIPTMHHFNQFDYCERPDLKARLLKIPFKHQDASLVIVLPDDKDGLDSLEDQPQVFSEQEYERLKVRLSLPKFKFQTGIEFNELLEKMGIKKMFSQEADLSGIAGKKGDLSVGPVLQKAFITVDEKGVEAGAATAAVLLPQVVHDPKLPKDFFVDHPFIFYIQVNDIVLLAGRVLDPRK